MREHQQKTFVSLGGFWLLRGWRGLVESIKKVKFVTKIFFPIMVSEVLKTCKKSYLLMHIYKSQSKTTRSKRTGCIM